MSIKSGENFNLELDDLGKIQFGTIFILICSTILTCYLTCISNYLKTLEIIVNFLWVMSGIMLAVLLYSNQRFKDEIVENEKNQRNHDEIIDAINSAITEIQIEFNNLGRRLNNPSLINKSLSADNVLQNPNYSIRGQICNKKRRETDICTNPVGRKHLRKKI